MSERGDRIVVVSRRGFLGSTATAGAGLVLGFVLPACRSEGEAPGPERGEQFEPNAWIRILPDGSVTLVVSRSEMGQGVMTALPMILAEELEVDFATVEIVQAGADEEKYGSQVTGGSNSVRSLHEPLRRAGATAREMLLAAAADVWQVDPKTCRAEMGTIKHLPSRRKRRYGELAERAARMAVPSNPPLKDPASFDLIGTRVRRVDAPAKVAGRAEFGIDHRLPGMLYAVVARPPVWGGRFESYDTSLTLEVPGVRKVVPLGSGVAVLAQNTWAALEGRKALRVTWNEGVHFDVTSEQIAARWESDQEKKASVAREEGEPAKVLGISSIRLDATYQLPFLAHAPMEPMSCLAHVRDGRCEVWAPTQSPGKVMDAAAEITGLPREAIDVHVTFMGGGFGRRLETDYAEEAIRLSEGEGLPVLVTWSREDDMRHGVYRPGSRHRLEAAVDRRGRLTAWTHRVIAPSISGQRGRLNEGELDRSAVSGAADLPYKVPGIRVDYVMSNTPVPVGYWRSVYHSQNAFAGECFMDEMAALAGRDPYEYRRLHLTGEPRCLGVLDLAAQKAGWRDPVPPGRGRGIALHRTFGTYVAQIAEVSVTPAGEVTVHRIVCAIDCGQPINPLTIEAQVEGSVVYGLTAALKGEITVTGGRVRQGNFDDYPLLRLDEMPAVETHIVPSGEPPTGAGEPAVPPVAPAVANAIHDATGVRIRSLPIRARELISEIAPEV